jgi:hypothetical protein
MLEFFFVLMMQKSPGNALAIRQEQKLPWLCVQVDYRPSLRDLVLLLLNTVARRSALSRWSSHGISIIDVYNSQVSWTSKATVS